MLAKNALNMLPSILHITNENPDVLKSFTLTYRRRTHGQTIHTTVISAGSRYQALIQLKQSFPDSLVKSIEGD